MGALDVLTKLGDAVAGVDPAKRYAAQSRVDEIQAQTESSLALARERRIQAEMAEQERAALERIGAMAPGTFNDPNAAPIGDLIVGKRGSDYAGAEQGRLHAQTFNERQTVETPAGLGDVAAEANRQAAMDALSPSSAIALRKPPTAARPGAPVIIEGDDGPVYETPANAIGRAPGVRPVAPRPPSNPGPTPQQRNIEYLQTIGVPQNDAVNIVMHTGDPRQAYVSILRTLTNQKDAAFRPVYSPEQAQDAATSAVDAVYGVGALQRAATGPVQPPVVAPPAGRPPLESFFHQ